MRFLVVASLLFSIAVGALFLPAAPQSQFGGGGAGGVGLATSGTLTPGNCLTIVDATHAGDAGFACGAGNTVVTDKGGQVCNVVAYGADKTGGSQVDSAVALAQTACPTGTVWFPVGTFLVSASGLTPSNSRQVFQGAGPGSIITQTTTNSSNQALIHCSGTANNKILNLTLAGQSTTVTGTTYQAGIQDDSCTNLEVAHDTFTGLNPGTNGLNISMFATSGATGENFHDNLVTTDIGTTGSLGYGLLVSDANIRIQHNMIIHSATQGRHQIYLSQSIGQAATNFEVRGNILVSGTNVQIECNATDGGDPPVNGGIIADNVLISTTMANQATQNIGAIDLNSNCKNLLYTHNIIWQPFFSGISIQGDTASTETGSPWTISGGGQCVRASNVDTLTSTTFTAGSIPLVGQAISIAGTSGGAGTVKPNCNGPNFIVLTSNSGTNTITFQDFGSNTTTTANTGTVTYLPARADGTVLDGNYIYQAGADGILCIDCNLQAIKNNTILEVGTNVGGGTLFNIGIYINQSGSGFANGIDITNNSVLGPTYMGTALQIDANSTNIYLDGNHFGPGSTATITDNGTATAYGTNNIAGTLRVGKQAPGFLIVGMTAQSTATPTPITNMSWSLDAKSYLLSCELPVTFTGSSTIAFELTGTATLSSYFLTASGNIGTTSAWLELQVPAIETALSTPTNASPAATASTAMIHLRAPLNVSAAGTVAVDTIANGTNTIQIRAGSQCVMSQMN